MNCPECTRWMHAYLDGDLGAAECREFETHLAGSSSCQAAVDSLRHLRDMARNLPQDIAPSRNLWPEIAAGLSSSDRPGGAALAFAPIQTWDAVPGNREAKAPSVLHWLAPLAMAASVAILATFAERRITPHRLPGWSVAALAGTPRIGAYDVGEQTRMRLGQWLETDGTSRARVEVGSIGEVSLEPNSRLRLVGMAAKDHRLELARGTLNAMIWAPPRLFFVDTPSATAVDLGCAYTLTVEDNGNGELHVSTGFVALEDRGRESIIRAGMMCLTRRGVGPGTPFAADAPAALRDALTRFDFEGGAANAALTDILAHARADDAITLWHLLDRTTGMQRADVFDRLAEFSPPPAGVTRAGILAGDSVMRKAWGTDLGIDRF